MAITCSSCQSANPDEMRFCGSCGQPLKRKCASCNSENPPQFRFCGQCAAPLAESRTSGTSQPSAENAERRQITVLFCDLVGSTKLSEELDPEELREVIRAYQTVSSEAIERYEGHIAQYLGDGLLVYFGYPRAHEDSARRAIHAGLDIVRSVGKLSQQLREKRGPSIAVRIGIHTGAGVAGDVGGKSKREQLVIGRTPNIAARLQDQAQPNCVVVSQATRQLVEGLFVMESLGERNLKGISEPMPLFKVLSESGAHGRFDMGQLPASPLVGRQAELSMIGERFVRNRQGQGQMVLISGEAGMGKSRLLYELNARFGTEALIMTGWCSPYAQNTPLHPLIGLFERLFGFEHEDSPERKFQRLKARLAEAQLQSSEALSLLASLFSLPTPAELPALTLSPLKQREHTLHLLVDILIETARHRHLFLILEDLHWSDPSTLQFIDLLITAMAAIRLFTVATFRPTFQPPWPPRRHMTRIDLSRLKDEEVTKIVLGLTGGRPLPRDVMRHLQERTDGVPIYIEEMTKAVLESRAVTLHEDRYELNRPLESLSIPVTLRDSLMARLDNLSSVKEVAQFASSIGRIFSFRMLADISQLDERHLRHCLRQLLAAELVFRSEEAGEESYKFKHALIQDTAHESMLRSKRREIHERIIRTLMQYSPGMAEHQPEILARHCEEAGRTEDAVQYLLRAGQRAMQRGAHVEAMSDFARALELLSAMPETPDRHRRELEVRVTMSGALIATRGYCAPELEQNCVRARELCSLLDESPELVPILYSLWVVNLASSRRTQTEEYARQLLERVKAYPEPGHELTAHFAHAVTLFYRGHFEKARAEFHRALERYTPDLHAERVRIYGDDHGLYCLVYLQWLELRVGAPERALEFQAQALALAEQFQDPLALSLALAFASLLWHDLRDPEQALALAERTLALTSEQGFFYWHSLAQCVKGWARAQRGEYEEGIRAIEQGLSFSHFINQKLPLTYWMSYLAEVHLMAGSYPKGLAVVEEALAMSAENVDSYNEPELLRLKGELLLAAGQDSAEAFGCFEQAIAVARQYGAHMLELRAAVSAARALSRQDRREQARELLGATLPKVQGGFDTVDQKEARMLYEKLM